MDYIFDNNIPIYLQIVDIIKVKIISGEYRAGEKVDSVRNLAQDFEVTPNTMQKALSDLESQGLLHTMRTKGRFVTDDKDHINVLRRKMASSEVVKTVDYLRKLNYRDEEINDIFDSILNKKEF